MANLLRGVAFITGAGSGIGQYTAYALARHGVRQLALCDVRPEVLATTRDELKKRHSDVEVLNIEMDTSKEDSVQSAVDQTVKKFGRLDIGINNAGIGGIAGQTADQELKHFQKVMDVNINGVWLCQRAQIRQMLQQEPLDPLPRGNRGVIINTASMLGLVASSPVSAAVSYTTSKHAVMGMTKTDAIAYAPRGIRINAMCPGYVGTPLLLQASETGAMDGEIAKVPQGRLGQMDEIADAMVFLASPMSSFMTGQGLVVDGGFTVGCY
ncbi:hypothetical protein LTR37_010018 [Vermiconidia calcicola]|uniref:Uncharacterized protein n=1 Tax=Vermiconidia calcicola TaxID=1690605 RepID=A0ACC3N5Y5_9PEZI|nr:hypothetical protein LTR37_010018 [Vermiconidia calcicola]